MERAEHLEWAKTRAIQELDYYLKEDPSKACQNAVASILSDLGKHEELRGHSAIKLGGMLLLGGHLGTEKQVRDFIVGFN